MRGAATGMLLVVAVVMSLASAASAAGAGWTAHQLGGEGAQAQLFGLSCPDTSLCVAVGGDDTVASSGDPLAPGEWKTIEVGDGAIGSPNQQLIKGVSCPTAGLCVAAGFLGQIFTSTDPTGGASSWSVADLSPSGPNLHFYGVSCPVATFCTAVGGGGVIATTTDPTGGVAAWTITHLAAPLELRGVSCTSPDFCVAVGDDGTDIRPAPGNHAEVVSSTAPGAGLWSQAELPGSHGSLYGVSCPSMGLCVSGDMFGNVVGTGEPTGPGAVWGSFPGGVSVQITAASCAPLGTCLLTDDNGDVLSSTEPSGGTSAWAVQNLIPFTEPPHNGLFSASCATQGLCAVGGVGQVLTNTEPPAGAVPSAARPEGSSKSKESSKGTAHTKHKPRPKHPRAILLGLQADEVALTGRKAMLGYRFHVDRRFQVRGYVCSLDGRTAHRCRSPQRFRVAAGHHRFRVWALGWTGLRGRPAEDRVWVCRGATDGMCPWRTSR